MFFLLESDFVLNSIEPYNIKLRINFKLSLKLEKLYIFTLTVCTQS